jgi:AcrR family transcriptional regulator
MSTGSVRAEHVQATRELIMTAAERLFAERGLAAVSARQISEAAGQGNTAAVGYHFGTKNGLVRAIIQRHTEDIERIRARMAGTARDGNLRDWVSCLVRPSAEHLDSLGTPTWFARFAVQVLADPELRPVLMKETFASPTIGQILKRLDESLSGMPAGVRAARDDMAYTLIVHVIARHERELARSAGGGAGPGGGAGAEDAGWHDAAANLIDAIVGLYQAPVTEPLRPRTAPVPERPVPEQPRP